MPHSDKFDEATIMTHSINDPVRPNNNLPNTRIASLWHDPSHLRKFLDNLGPTNHLKTESRRPLRMVLRDKTDQIAQIVASHRRPSQLVSHEANCFLTSS